MVLAVPLAILGMLIRLRLGSPVLFRQIRPGLKGRPFKLYKFRTMTDERDATGRLLPDERRLTGLGASCARSAWTICPTPSTCCGAK